MAKFILGHIRPKTLTTDTWDQENNRIPLHWWTLEKQQPIIAIHSVELEKELTKILSENKEGMWGNRYTRKNESLVSLFAHVGSSPTNSLDKNHNWQYYSFNWRNIMPRTKQTLKEKRLTALRWLTKERNAHFLIDYTYDTEHPCEPGGCGGICRCEILRNVRVATPINPEKYSESLIRSVDEGSIYHYCLERLLTIHKIYDSGLWEFIVNYGYYGQEINGATFKNKDKLLKDIDNIIDISDIDAIKFVLIKEYGYLLPALEKCTQATIVTIDLDKIIKNTNTYHKRITDCEFYINRSLPMAICMGEDVFNIVDGWHRLTAKIASKAKKHKVIVLS